MRRAGLEYGPRKTAGTHPRFITMIRELIEERISNAADRPALGQLGASHDVCPADCCLAGALDRLIATERDRVCLSLPSGLVTR